MFTRPAKTGHDERTSREPRNSTLHSVVLSQVETINERILTCQLDATDQSQGIEFLPGQWLDVHVPGLVKPGGFTITSSPCLANPSINATPHVCLAIQKSPENPAAEWFWRPKETIIGQEVRVRVGGSFVWPPPSVDLNAVDHTIFVAGGVGINPLISILDHLDRTEALPPKVTFFYSTKAGKMPLDMDRILFLAKLVDIEAHSKRTMSIRLFVTDKTDKMEESRGTFPQHQGRRLIEGDLSRALAAGDIQQTVCYVCGPPTMTDGIVSFFQAQEGMDKGRVLCEKWW